MGDADPVLVERRGAVQVVTLNRPERLNALSGPLTVQLIEAIRSASEDDDVRAVVLTGAGRGFCAGADLGGGRSPAGGGGGTASRYQQLHREGTSGDSLVAFAECDVPIIAALNGPAAGAGFGIAVCCDIRFMAESARIGPVFIRRGVASDYGAAYWLPRIVGVARALELFYDGDPIDAERALAIGLVHRVVPDDALLDEAIAYAQRIADGPPRAYTYTRRLIHRAGDMSVRDFAELEWTYQADLLRTKDAIEGFTSFQERRKPNFTGE